MCRTSNTKFLSLGRLQWRNDSLAVFFAKTKSDQGGERLKDPLHLYANPAMPEICPVLALGL